MTPEQIFLISVVLGPWLWVEYLKAKGSDWPADCTPFEGEAQRWSRERQQADELAGREWGEVADLPPMSKEIVLGPSDERFLDTLNSQPEPPTQRRVRPEKQPKTVIDPEVEDTLRRAEKLNKKIQAEEKARKEIAPSLEFTNRKF